VAAVTASRTPSDSYVNARSEECLAEPSSADPERGLRVVMYRDEVYVIVGVYFARGPYGGRDLRYILGPIWPKRGAPPGP